MGAFFEQLIASQTHPAVVDWVRRIVSNGGAAPSRRTVWAADRFYKTLVSKGLLSSQKIVSIFAPDSLIACCTPLVNTGGNVLWVNHSFVAADLTLAGLKGDGSTKYLDTGFLPSSVFTSTAGMTLYNSTASNGTEQDMGCLAGNLNDAVEHNAFQMHISVGGSAVCDPFADITGRINVSNSSWTGYLSLNRTSNTLTTLYRASSTTTHATLGTNSADLSAWTAPAKGMTVFCGVANDVGQFSLSTKRLAFAAVHNAFTATQSQDYFNAVQQVRTDLGGGAV